MLIQTLCLSSVTGDRLVSHVTCMLKPWRHDVASVIKLVAARDDLNFLQ